MKVKNQKKSNQIIIYDKKYSSSQNLKQQKM